MSPAGPLPEGFSVGHWSDPDAATGCTVVIPPPGSRCGVDIRGGGPGTRETDVIAAGAGRHEASAVLLSGGSAYGLAAADGVMAWLEEHGRGHPTTAGIVPIVPAAVIYDLAEGEGGVRPGPAEGRAACEAATADPGSGRVGAGTGAAVGKILGRERACPAGIGVAAATTGRGERVTALAVANAFGDVLAEDGSPIGSARDEAGEPVPAAEAIAAMEVPPDWSRIEERNTTLVCVLTDAGLDGGACARVARMTSAGVARAVEPVFSDLDGDVVFCLSAGVPREDRFSALAVGTVAAAVTAAAIRAAVPAS
ncbi:MAG: P1 family peptidase [Solirubrobacterales bacterium]